MGRPANMNNAQQAAIKLLASVCGYCNERITELMLPIVDNGNLKLDVLQKRVDRLLPDGGRKFNPSDVTAGTYLLHKIDVTYTKKTSKKTDPLLIIMEMHTGWINAVLLPKITPESIKPAMHQIFTEINCVHKIKLPLIEIIFLSYNHLSQARAKKGETAIEMAALMRKPITELISDIRESLNTLHKSMPITTRLIDAQPNDQVEVEGVWTGLQLNKKISLILDKYNNDERSGTTFPSTKDDVSPKIRLQNAHWKAGRKPKFESKVHNHKHNKHA